MDEYTKTLFESLTAPVTKQHTPAEVDKNVKTEVAVLGDAKQSLKDLLPLLNAK